MVEEITRKIALKYKVSVSNLMEWNNLKSSLIYLDQNIIVDRKDYSNDYQTFTFQDGKSLQFWEIAKKFDCSVRD